MQAFSRGLYDWLILAGAWHQAPTAAASAQVPAEAAEDSDSAASEGEEEPKPSRKRKRDPGPAKLRNATCAVALDPPASAAGANLLPP